MKNHNLRTHLHTSVKRGSASQW